MEVELKRDKKALASATGMHTVYNIQIWMCLFLLSCLLSGLCELATKYMAKFFHLCF